MSHLPGRRLLRFAERTFDRATVETVIAPAIADLQHECAASNAGRPTLVTAARSYWAVLKTIALCLIGHVVRDRHLAGRALAGRIALLMAVFVTLLSIPPLRAEIAVAASHGMRSAVLSVLFSLPQAFVASMPAALFFALVFHRERAVDGKGSSTPTIIAAVFICTTMVFGLLMFAVPQTNQAYRVVVANAAFSRMGQPVPVLRRGLAEMTLPMLNHHIAHPPSVREEALARAHRRQRFAFVALVSIVGVLGFGLAGRWRSRYATLGASLIVLVLYVMCFSLGGDRRHGSPSLYWPWVANGLFLLLAIALLRWRPAATNATVPASE